MKYSVLTLLLTTGYLGLMIAGLKEPDSVWRLAASLAWLTVTGYAAVCAFQPANDGSATFGRVMLSCTTIYMILTFLPNGPSDWLPHPIVARMYLMWGAPDEYRLGPDGTLVFGDPTQFVQFNPYNPTFARYEPEPIVGLCSAQLFGLLAGIFAAWRIRRIG